jgi:ankyrin repeat protein
LKAAYSGHFHIVKYLVSKTANIHLKDKDGWTSLHNACARGYLPIVRLLVDQGARVDVRSKMGHTPLSKLMTPLYI